MVIESRAARLDRRWVCSCSTRQALRWLDLAAEHALAEGGEASARLSEAVGHFLAVARRMA